MVDGGVQLKGFHFLFLNQLDRASEDASQNELEVGTSHSMNDCVEGARTERAGHLRYALKAFFVGVTAVMIAYLLHKKPLFFDYF